MIVFYLLSQYPLDETLGAVDWAKCTCGIGTISGLVEHVAKKGRFVEPLTFEEDGRTPKGVYHDAFGFTFALRLEYTALVPSVVSNHYTTHSAKQWTPNPICPWGGDNAFGKKIPYYRKHAALQLIAELRPDLDIIQQGYIVGVARRAVERDTLNRNQASLLRYLDHTGMYRLLAVLTTG
ncbi:MAG: hypothetical protein RR280_08610 [Bacteroidaceae bacterium]